MFNIFIFISSKLTAKNKQKRFICKHGFTLINIYYTTQSIAIKLTNNHANMIIAR